MKQILSGFIAFHFIILFTAYAIAQENVPTDYLQKCL